MRKGVKSLDAQRKKGLLDILVLSVLTEGPSYGYKIIQNISEIMEISESTMYPVFRRLENTGCVTTYSEEHNGRKRKYFAVTQAGMEKIDAFLKEWQEMKKIYGFVEKSRRSVR